jgi:hypothetical protein
MEENQKAENRILSKFYNSCQAFAGIAILWLIIILLLSVFESIFNNISHGLKSGFFEILAWSTLLKFFVLVEIDIHLFHHFYSDIFHFCKVCQIGLSDTDCVTISCSVRAFVIF